MVDFNIPVLPLEEYEIPEIEKDQVINEVNGAVDYAVIGSGQCGGRIAKAFYDIGYKKVVAINTARQDLSTLELPDAQKILLDIGEMGAG